MEEERNVDHEYNIYDEYISNTDNILGQELVNQVELSKKFGDTHNEQSFVEFGDTMDKNYLGTKELTEDINRFIKNSSKYLEPTEEIDTKQSKCLEQEHNFEPRSDSSQEIQDELIQESMKQEFDVFHNINNNDFSGRVSI